MWVEWDTALLLKGQWCSSHLSEVALIWHAGSLILRRCLSFGMLVLSFIFPLKKRQENNPCLFSIIKLNAARAERKASCQNICELFAF